MSGACIGEAAVKRASRRRTTFYLVGLFAVVLSSLLICTPYLTVMSWFGDEGILIDGGQNILDGRKLYKDFFEFFPPVGLLITAGWMSLFGKYLWSVRLLVEIAITLIAVLVYLACALVSRSILLSAFIAIAWLVMSQPTWMMVLHHWMVAFFAMASALATLWSIRSGDRGAFPFLAGVAAGAGAVVTPSRGMLALAATVVSFVDFRKLGPLAWTLAGCFVVPLACLAYICFNGIFQPAYKDIVEFTLNSYSAVQKVSFGSGATKEDFPLVLLFPLTGCLALLAAASMGKAGLTDPLFRASLAFGVAGFLGCFPRPDSVHIRFSVPLLLPLTAFCFSQLTLRWPNHWRDALLLAVALLCVRSARALGRDEFFAYRSKPVETLRGPLIFRSEAADGGADMIREVASLPGEDGYLFYPYLPLAPFLTGKRQVTGIDVFVPGYTTPEQYRQACLDTERKAQWVVVDRWWQDPPYLKVVFPAMRDPQPPEKTGFERAIYAHFGLVKRFGHFEVWRRTSAPNARDCDQIPAGSAGVRR